MIEVKMYAFQPCSNPLLLLSKAHVFSSVLMINSLHKWLEFFILFSLLFFIQVLLI